MNKYTTQAIVLCVFLLVVGGCEMQRDYLDKQPEIEAIKSGLIQKVDPETKQVIWTKP